MCGSSPEGRISKYFHLNMWRSEPGAQAPHPPPTQKVMTERRLRLVCSGPAGEGGQGGALGGHQLPPVQGGRPLRLRPVSGGIVERHSPSSSLSSHFTPSPSSTHPLTSCYCSSPFFRLFLLFFSFSYFSFSSFLLQLLLFSSSLEKAFMYLFTFFFLLC